MFTVVELIKISIIISTMASFNENHIENRKKNTHRLKNKF